MQTEEDAEKGYRELIRVLGRRGFQAHGGVRLGSPKDAILVGLTLDTAAPLFADPFAMRPRILGVMGDSGTGKTFAAHLFALRAKWTWPDRRIDIADGQAVAYPHDYRKVRGIKVVPRAVIATVDGEGKLISGGMNKLEGTAPDWPFRGVMFRMKTPPDTGILRPTEARWLPNARLPREAGYSEGLFTLPYGNVPIAVVASTPEYEYLTATLAPLPNPVIGA